MHHPQHTSAHYNRYVHVRRRQVALKMCVCSTTGMRWCTGEVSLLCLEFERSHAVKQHWTFGTSLHGYGAAEYAAALLTGPCVRADDASFYLCTAVQAPSVQAQGGAMRPSTSARCGSMPPYEWQASGRWRLAGPPWSRRLDVVVTRSSP